MATCDVCGTIYKSHNEPGRKCPHAAKLHGKTHKIKKTDLLTFNIFYAKLDKALRKHEANRTRRRGRVPNRDSWAKIASKRHNQPK